MLAWLKQRLQRDILRLGRPEPQTDLRAIFPRALMPSLSLPDRQVYPPIVSLAKDHIFGYRMHCLLTYQGKEALDTLLRGAGFMALPAVTEHFSGVIEHSTNETRIFLNQYIDFAGVCINLVTNNNTLLAALVNFKSAPPTPWESFADVDPDTLGSLQGNIDFWCNYFWRPYWLSLSAAERLQYPVKWQEFSDFH